MKWARNLSEAIILQSLEDLFNHEHRMDALRFFNGEGFDICASIIGLKKKETEKVFQIVNKSFDAIKRDRAAKKSTPLMQNKLKARHTRIPKMIYGAFHQNVDNVALHHI
jgi:hypothetical protein